MNGETFKCSTDCLWLVGFKCLMRGDVQLHSLGHFQSGIIALASQSFTHGGVVVIGFIVAIGGVQCKPTGCFTGFTLFVALYLLRLLRSGQL